MSTTNSWEHRVYTSTDLGSTGSTATALTGILRGPAQTLETPSGPWEQYRRNITTTFLEELWEHYHSLWGHHDQRALCEQQGCKVGLVELEAKCDQPPAPIPAGSVGPKTQNQRKEPESLRQAQADPTSR